MATSGNKRLSSEASVNQGKGERYIGASIDDIRIRGGGVKKCCKFANDNAAGQRGKGEIPKILWTSHMEAP